MKFSLEPIDENALYLTVGTVVTEELWIAIAKKFEAITRVRELHQDNVLFGLPTCTYCDEPYPCPTIKALDGEQ